MQRPSLAHFSRQLSLRYVDLLLPRARVLQSYITHHVAAVARAFVDLPPGRYQV